MISPSEKIQIIKLLQSPQWKSVENLANEMIDRLKDDSQLRDSEWDTLKEVLLKEGRIRGIREFIQEIYNLASQNEQR